jgi:hypothetical protein
MRMRVPKNIEADITNYSGTKDFHVVPEYVDEHTYTLHVKRLDADAGWAENIRVLAVYGKEKSEVIVVGNSDSAHKSMRITTDATLYLSDEPVEFLSSYSQLPWMEPQRIGRETFNGMFKTNIVVLPKNLFAVGIKYGCVYMYAESYECLYMIELTIRHMVGVALSKNMYRMFHFIICAYDGYMEGHRLSRRYLPKVVGERECAGVMNYTTEAGNEYPVFYDQKWVVAQSNQLYTPFSIDMPDRYYFYLNRYNQYRSVHEGIPFSKKTNKIVYGSQPRGGKLNFTRRKDIEMSQRAYFYSDAVPKDNIVAPQWIDRSEMIKYKYVLDIDGNASTWDATAWKLNSGSVIMKVEGPWRQWFYNEYKPWIHYVPVKEDMSDIQEKYRWCEEHPSECEAMIDRCKALFQKVYRYENVVKHTTEMIEKMSGLPCYTHEKQRLCFFSTQSSDMGEIRMKKYSNGNKVLAAKDMCSRLHDSDIIIHVNSDLTDAKQFDIPDLLKRYKDCGGDIVFGTEKNIWPGSLNMYRETLDRLASPAGTDFKYLNAGFFIARVGELRRLMKERVYIISMAEQEYFSLAYLTGRYSFALDYKSMIVMNRYMTHTGDIDRFNTQKTPFFHHNAGR